MISVRIIKLGADGSTRWDASPSALLFYSVTEIQDGNYIAVGQSISSGGEMFGIFKGRASDAVVAKWVKSFGDSNDESFHSIIPAADGGFVAAGNSRSSNLDMNGLHSTSNTEPIAIAVKYQGGKPQTVNPVFRIL